MKVLVSKEFIAIDWKQSQKIFFHKSKIKLQILFQTIQIDNQNHKQTYCNFIKHLQSGFNKGAQYLLSDFKRDYYYYDAQFLLRYYSGQLKIHYICISAYMTDSTTHFAQFLQDQDFGYSHQHESCVRLILIDPQLNHRPLSPEDVFELREQHPDITSIQMQSTREGKPKAVICFGSVDDVVEFQFNLRSSLTYSFVYIQSSDFQFGNSSPFVYYSPKQLEQQIHQEGFFKKNGLIHMEKITSIEHLICDDCEKCEKSTLFQTQRKISIDEETEENHQEESEQYEEPLQHKKSLIKPLIENIFITVLFFGGVKLFKMFTK